MTLDFELLVIDDDPGPSQQALQALRDHLDGLGFELAVTEHAADFSDATLTKLSRAGGRNYDLVMIDYRLDSDDQDGATVARRLRTELPYTDMVFYSSDPTAALLGELAKQEVDGVFVARRQELGDSLTGLADTVIRKTVDLTHMRGMVMAEVAEMDTLLEEALAGVLDSGLPLPSDAGRRAVAKLCNSMRKDAERSEQRVEAGKLAEVVRNSRLFGLDRKFRLLVKVAEKLPDRPPELDVLATFKDDIIDRRNVLAHVREESADGGTKILRSIKPAAANVIFDDERMKELRLLLRKHKPALIALCDAVVRQLAQIAAEAQAQEH